MGMIQPADSVPINHGFCLADMGGNDNTGEIAVVLADKNGVRVTAQADSLE